MRFVRFALLALLACSTPTSTAPSDPSVLATPNITVKPAKVFQTWTAWEVASVNPADPAYSYSPALADAVTATAVNEFHITRIRLQAPWNNIETASAPTGNPDSPYLWANDNADPNVTTAAGFRWTEFDGVVERWVLPLRQRAGANFRLNLNVVCMTTSCKPPANNAAEYAEFVRTVVAHLQARWGLRPDYIELMLEPTQTATQLGKNLAALRSTMDLTGIKIIGPSLVNATTTATYAGGLQAVAGAGALDEVSYHRYGTVPTQTTLNGIATYAATHSATTSMLEHIGANQTELYQDLAWAKVSAWQRYTLAGPANTTIKQGKLLFVNPSTGSITFEPGAWYLWQYMHFVMPGDTRIGAATSTSLIKPVAFRAPNGRISVVAIVSGKITLNVAGLPAGTYRVWWSTGTQHGFLGATKTIAAGALFSVTVPAAGVVTIAP